MLDERYDPFDHLEEVDEERVAWDRRQLLTRGLVAGGTLLAGGALAGRAAAASGAGASAICSLKGKREGIPSPLHIEVLDLFWSDMKKTAQLGGTGLQITVVDAGGNNAKQVALGEQFVAQGFNALHINAGSAPPWLPVVRKAIKQQMVVFNHSPSAITGATQNILIDHFTAGYQNGTAAAAWLNSAHGGKGGVGLVDSIESHPIALRGQGFRAAIKKLAPGATVHAAAVVPLNAVEKGASAAQSLVQNNPDIRVIFCYNDDTAAGVVTALKEIGKTSPNDYFVTGVDGNPTVLKQIASGKTPMGSTAAFFFRYSAVQTERDTEKALCGMKVPPTRIMISRLASRQNAAKVISESQKPFSPAAAPIYKDIMHYFDKPVVTGGPVPIVKQP